MSAERPEDEFEDVGPFGASTSSDGTSPSEPVEESDEPANGTPPSADGTPPSELVEEPAEAEEPSVETQLQERTLDLQRLQAEYVNYRKRVERDRALSRQQGEAAVLKSLLTVLDDIGRADQHGELTGGFKAVSDTLQQAVRSHRLEVFGAEGDAFDPRLHEALFQVGESPDVTDTTVGAVIRTGYRVGDEVLRHAQVGVLEPGSPDAAGEPDEAGEQSSDDE